jgi:hypothetical protein
VAEIKARRVETAAPLGLTLVPIVPRRTIASIVRGIYFCKPSISARKEGAPMPDQKIMELCTEITAEKDSKKLIALVEELNRLLPEEQDQIKDNINRRLDKVMAAPE